MRYVELGATGERVSALCLGTMMFGERCDETESARIFSLAVECGVTFIDTAAMYANGLTEEILGEFSSTNAIASSSPPRSTKALMPPALWRVSTKACAASRQIM